MSILMHNMLASNAQRQLAINTRVVGKSMEKLSSGYRINRAADDAAGLSISEKMRRQIRGLEQGIRNTQDGISVCQVADGALAEVNDMIQRIGELSVQAANGVLAEIDRQAIDEEVQQIKIEIDRVSKSTEFNEIHLFDGIDYGNGSTGGAGGTVPIAPSIQFPTGSVQKIDSASLASLASSIVNGVTHYVLPEGIYEIDTGITNVVFDVSGKSVIQNSTLNDVSLNCQQGTELYIKNLSITNGSTLDYNAIDFNGKGNKLIFGGVNELKTSAGAGVNVSEGEEVAIDGDGILNIHAGMGAGIGGCCVNQSGADLSGHDYGTIVINSGTINSSSNSGAGIGSSLWPVFQSTGNITINGGTINASANTGAGIGAGWIRDVRYDERAATGNAGTITINGGNVTAYSDDAGAGIGGGVCFGGADVTINGGYVHASSGDFPGGAGIGCGSIFMDVLVSGGSFDCDNYDFTNYPVNFGSVTINGGKVDAVGGEISEIGAEYSFGIGGFYLTDPKFNSNVMDDYVAMYNNNVTIEGKTIAPSEMLMSIENGRYVYHYDDTKAGGGTGGFFGQYGEIWIQSGYEHGDGMYLTIGTMNTTSLGLDQVSCRSQEDALDSLSKVAKALERLSEQRSRIGAQQNRLEHTIKNESNIVENTTASEAMIRDTDMAKEMVKLSNYNILTQAGQAMLAQANQSNQGILSLLQE